MKTAVLTLAWACFLCIVSDRADAAPAAPEPPKDVGATFFDKIFNIPRSVIHSVNKNLNESGAKCSDGSAPVNVDGKGTCHDRALGISKSALDSVNDLLNG